MPFLSLCLRVGILSGTTVTVKCYLTSYHGQRQQVEILRSHQGQACDHRCFNRAARENDREGSNVQDLPKPQIKPEAMLGNKVCP